MKKDQICKCCTHSGMEMDLTNGRHKCRHTCTPPEQPKECHCKMSPIEMMGHTCSDFCEYPRFCKDCETCQQCLNPLQKGIHTCKPDKPSVEKELSGKTGVLPPNWGKIKPIKPSALQDLKNLFKAPEVSSGSWEKEFYDLVINRTHNILDWPKVTAFITTLIAQERAKIVQKHCEILESKKWDEWVPKIGEGNMFGSAGWDMANKANVESHNNALDEAIAKLTTPEV